MRVRAAVLGVGAFYVLGVGVMFAVGWGIPAAYLTMPGWLVVAAPTLILPPSALDVIASWTGNLVSLMSAAALNVAAAYWLVRGLSKA